MISQIESWAKRENSPLLKSSPLRGEGGVRGIEVESRNGKT